MQINILKSLSDEQAFIINLIGCICKKNNIKAYLVGGAVRDILLDRNINDIDICIEENPIKLIGYLEKYMERYQFYKDFQTSTINFKNGITIDLIRCRKEIYNCPGSLPKVFPSFIEEDLYRRDFTINALAYDLIEEKIIDHYSGIKDLKNGRLRKIHSNSYEEDPTRAFRAAKYAIRYNFKMNDEEEIRNAIRNGVINAVSIDRIIKELYLICREDKWIEIILYLEKLNLFTIDGNKLGKECPLESYDNINIRILNLFYSLISKNYVDHMVSNSILPIEIKNSIKKYMKDSYMIDYLEKKRDNYTIDYYLKNSTYYERVLLGWNYRLKYKVINYERNLKFIKLSIDGDFVVKLGVEQGIMVGKILEHMKKIKLNTGIKRDKEYLIKNLGEILHGIENKDR